MTASNRPLSPHLQIWKWTLTMTQSILHRATGIANTIGLFILVWWLIAAAAGPNAYEIFLTFASHPIGRIMMMGWVFSVYAHMLGGIRHMIMDTGRLYEIRTAKLVVLFVWVASAVLTLATWMTIFGGEQ